jgi:hypothetical protein
MPFEVGLVSQDWDMPVDAYNCQLRVVVVEANPLRRTTLINKLRHQFSAVVAAEGVGAALLEDAARLVREACCHVAVVTHDPVDLHDPTANLDALREQLAPAGVVICAVQPNDRLAFLAGRHTLEYVRCDDPASDLCAAVEARGRLGCKCDLQAHWPGADPEGGTGFAASTAERLKLAASEVSPEHLYDLLGRLFPQAEEVTLKPLHTLNTATLVASVVRQSVVLLASERRPGFDTERIPAVIKIGPRAQIVQERQNYERYVDGWLMQNRLARLEDDAQLWHLGAIVYAFLGADPGDMVPFRTYYLKSPARSVLGVLRQLFAETCRKWYANEREQVVGTPLYELYEEKLGLRDRMQDRLDMRNSLLRFPGIDEALPNPGLWAVDIGRRVTNGDPTTCITHGDLHADNFFVDRSQQAWLIDFGQTGYSHALRDFVELEADIKLRLTDFRQEQLAGLLALENGLLAGERLDDPLLPPAAVAANPRLLKAFTVIAGLRHLAAAVSGVTDTREYLEALLYESLFMSTLRRLHEAVRQRAYFSAALIARRLRNGVAPDGEPDGGPAVPTFDVKALADLSPTERQRAAEDHHKHLTICVETLDVLGALYGNARLPAGLDAGRRRVRQALLHAEQLRQTIG